jgi:hypothetical protein
MSGTESAMDQSVQLDPRFPCAPPAYSHGHSPRVVPAILTARSTAGNRR